jgi:RNase P protein component
MFSGAFRQGKLASSEHFDLFAAMPPAADQQIQLGLAISRKAAPTAVLRNLARRISRESARASMAILPLRSYVLRGRLSLRGHWEIAKKAKSTSHFKHDLRSELDALFATAARRVRNRSA